MRLSHAIAVASMLATAPSATAAAQTTSTPQTTSTSSVRAPTTTGLPSAPMPTQKQTIEYFEGAWTFKWMGPDTPLGPGPRSGTVTFSRLDGGPGLGGEVDAKSEDGPYRETVMLSFNPDAKELSWSERRAGGVQVKMIGDWSSPLSIRFEIAPVTIKGQTYRLKRTLSVISAGSFTVIDEYAAGTGPFKRLGNGLFTKQAR